MMNKDHLKPLKKIYTYFSSSITLTKMSNLEYVKQKCATYEQYLEKNLPASGRGLHEKVNSVEHSLSVGIVKKLRLIATIRNKMFHDPDYDFHDSKKSFKEVCAEIEEELKISPQPVKLSKNRWFKRNVPGFLFTLIILGVILILTCSFKMNWGLEDKIVNNRQEIFKLQDQIKHEKSKIKAIKEKYSKIRFWQNKSREDIIEIERAETRIKLLDLKKSEKKDELSKLKGRIDKKGVFAQIPKVLTFVILTLMLAALSFFILVTIVYYK